MTLFKPSNLIVIPDHWPLMVEMDGNTTIEGYEAFVWSLSLLDAADINHRLQSIKIGIVRMGIAKDTAFAIYPIHYNDFVNDVQVFAGIGNGERFIPSFQKEAASFAAFANGWLADLETAGYFNTIRN